MASQYANNWFSELLDLVSGDSFKVILMETGFIFDRDSHVNYADISADELTTANGYTVNTKVLANPSLAIDNDNDNASLSFDDVVFTASGGSIGPLSGAIIFDDTLADDPIVKWIEAASDITITDGNQLNITSVALTLSE